MKKVCAIIFLLGNFIFSFSLRMESFGQGTWTQMANFGGTARYYAVGFSIGTKGYIGTGSDAGGYTKDFWEWNQATNTWTQMAIFPGIARDGAVGFSIGTKGYIGTGNGTSDFYEYDQAGNTWIVRAPYGGGGMSASSGFGITSTGKGYLGGSGLDAAFSFTRKFYEFNQATNSWLVKASPPFGATSGPLWRYYAAAFSIGTKGYLGSGGSASGNNRKDFYEYNPATDTWLVRTNYTTNAFGVWNGTGFSIGTKGYLFSGEDDLSALPLDFKEFDQAGNTWTAKTSMSVGRQRGVSFSIGTCGYVGTGMNGTGLLKDFWEWSPGASCVALPITLLSFTGEALQNETNLLHWITASEQNNDYFTIEKSDDGIFYSELIRIKGAGSSSMQKKYSTFDNEPYPNLTYYRLKQTDFDGKFTYSNTVTVSSKPDVISLYPNPANDKVYVKLFSKEAGVLQVDIFDLSGQMVLNQSFQKLKGANNININVNSLSQGVYMLCINNSSRKKQLKFVKM